MFVIHPVSFLHSFQLSSFISSLNHSLAVTHPPKAPRALFFFPVHLFASLLNQVSELHCSFYSTVGSFSKFSIICYSILPAKQGTLILSVASEYFPCIHIIFILLFLVCLYTKPHIPLIHTNLMWDICVLTSVVEGSHSFSPTNSFVESLRPNIQDYVPNIPWYNLFMATSHVAAKAGTIK